MVGAGGVGVSDAGRTDGSLWPRPSTSSARWWSSASSSSARRTWSGRPATRRGTGWPTPAVSSVPLPWRSGGAGPSPSRRSRPSPAAVYLARGYPGGPALLPGPLALLALGYPAPRRVALDRRCRLPRVSVHRARRRRRRRSGTATCWRSSGWRRLPCWPGRRSPPGASGPRPNGSASPTSRSRRLADERLRIAQDLHDSVAHAMATINVQSGVAAHLLDRDPAQAKGALEAIRAASSDALDELGAILGVLRDPGAAAPRCPGEHARRRRRRWSSGPAPTGCRRDLRRARVGRLGGDVGERGGLPGRAGGADQRPPPRRQRGARPQLDVAIGDRWDGEWSTRRRRRPGTARADGSVEPDSGWSACGSGSSRPAGCCAPDRAATVASRSSPRGTVARDPGRRSPTTRCSCAPGSGPCSTPRTTSRSSARRATAPRRSSSLAAELRPDVVLMDIRMPDVDGLDRGAPDRRATTTSAGVKVLVLTTFELDEYVYEALRAGASGFLVKHTEPAELIRAVRVVAAGDALLSPGVTRRLIAAFADARPPVAAEPDARDRRAAHGPRARGRGPRRRRAVERGDRRAVGASATPPCAPTSAGR